MWIMHTLLLMLARHVVDDGDVAWKIIARDDPINFMLALYATTRFARLFVASDSAVWFVHVAALVLAHGVTDVSRVFDVPGLRVVASSHPLDLAFTLWLMHIVVGTIAQAVVGALRAIWELPGYVWVAVRDFSAVRSRLDLCHRHVADAHLKLKIANRHLAKARRDVNNNLSCLLDEITAAEDVLFSMDHSLKKASM
jgi:hypothetical protein